MMLVDFAKKCKDVERMRDVLLGIDPKKLSYIELNRCSSLLYNALWECDKELERRRKGKP